MTTGAEVFRSEPKAGQPLKTTLEVATQNAADAALRGEKRRSALVAVRIGDGAVLAAANGPGPAGENLAFTAQVPPGSTFKTVSALALAIPCRRVPLGAGTVFFRSTHSSPITPAISARSQSGAPYCSAARRLSTTEAASPFMKTLRRSFSAAASPASVPTTSTRIPTGPSRAANRSAPVPEASAGVSIPRRGTEPSRATSANSAPAEAIMPPTSRFLAGRHVFRSAYT